MENTLREYLLRLVAAIPMCLNPCFNGKYSQRNNDNQFSRDYSVLILVLMENTLREVRVEDPKKLIRVLILVLMENTLRTRHEDLSDAKRQS